MLEISDIRHRHLLFRYRNQICRTNPFHSDIGRVPLSTSASIRYRTKSISDIPISKIDQSFPNDPSKILVHLMYLTGFEPANFTLSIWCLTTGLRGLFNLNVRYKISDKNLFRCLIYVMSDSALFSPISDVPISGSVRYIWSWIADWVPTYAFEDIITDISESLSLLLCMHFSVRAGSSINF